VLVVVSLDIDDQSILDKTVSKVIEYSEDGHEEKPLPCRLFRESPCYEHYRTKSDKDIDSIT
jgi:hypothetical protein